MWGVVYRMFNLSIVYEAPYTKMILHIIKYEEVKEGNNRSLSFEDVLIRQSNYFLFFQVKLSDMEEIVI